MRETSSFLDRLTAMGGETGRLIAFYDWSATSLGPLDHWTASLKIATELMLRSTVPIVMLWGEDGIMLYNDAYSGFAGGRHPRLLGSKVREGWPEVADFNDNVMRVGLAGGTLSYKDQELTLYRNGRPEQVFMNLDYSPVPGDDGRPGGVLAIVVETTERVRSERLQAFRLDLKERLRELSEPGRVMDVAVEALGTYLGANRAGYSEIQGDEVAILACYANGVAPLSGTYRLDAFGPESNARQRGGRIEVCDDVLADPAQVHATWAAIETRAFVSVPLVRNGRFTASMFVNFQEPHVWRDDEIGLIEDVASRTWEAVERARAEAAAARAQSEQAATASTLNALITNAPIGFAFFDRAHRYTRINDVLAHINGIAADTHLGRTIEELLPVNARLVGPVLDQVFATGRPIDGLEIDGETPASPGEPRSWLTGFFPVFEGDAVVQVGATVVDITERKRAEEKLRASEERLRLATENAEVGFWDVDEVNQRLHWPAIVKAMFGISADVPVTMQDFYEGLHPDDRRAVSEAYAAAADPARRAVYDVEYRTVGKEDSVIRWVAAKGRGVFDDEGRCLRVLGTVMDISVRKASEAALAASEARLRELNQTLERRVAEVLAERKLLADVVDGTDIFVQVVDRDFNWLAINKASSAEFARIFGVRPPRAGDNMLAMLDQRPEHRAAVQEVWGRALAGEEFVEINAFGDPLLARRYYEMRFRTLRDAQGQPHGAYQFVTDVTERLLEQSRLKEAEAALAQAQKMEAVGQLTGGIAHDFNNLLGAVVGSFDLIRRRPNDIERVRRYAEAGLQAAERGAKLTHQLLAFSRAQRLEIKPVAVSSLVEGMRNLLDRTLGPIVHLEVDLQGDGAVLSDPTQLEMAILNLAINARDAMPDGGDLTISTRPVRIDGDVDLETGDYVEIAVTDTGSGMPPEVVARAFDPFFTTKGVGKGTGLGLSQVYGIARQAGGTVRIDSQVGRGTTVRIYLRRTAAPDVTDAAVEQGIVSRPRTAATILIVDDDPDLRGVLIASLEELGYLVLEAEDGHQGLAMIDHRVPDLLMVDFAMPGMSGAQVAKAARQRRPDLPIVFASGYADTGAIERAAVDAAVLRKPFRVDELQAVLAEALGAKHR
ncbi:PAS domain-containing protein [Bradyrhizobium sp. USDA 4353]